MSKKVTIKTISEASGVSTSIVSRILSGKAKQYRVAEKTTEKVMAIARKLNYRPNYFAKSLNSTRTFNIGLIFANSVDSFLGSIMEGVEASLRGTECQMVVATCENSPDVEQLEIDRMLYRQVDGIIIYPSAMPSGVTYPIKHLQKIRAGSTPLVVIGREIPVEADFVLFDDFAAGREAAEIFLQKGCRKFGALTLPIECSSDNDRIAGFTSTLESAGITQNDIIISVSGANRMPDTAEIKRLREIDALFAVNTSLLINYADALVKAGKKNDFQCYALGVEDFQHMLPFSGTFRPMPGREMGRQAADILLNIIDTGNPEYSVQRLPWPPAVNI